MIKFEDQPKTSTSISQQIVESNFDYLSAKNFTKPELAQQYKNPLFFDKQLCSKPDNQFFRNQKSLSNNKVEEEIYEMEQSHQLHHDTFRINNDSCSQLKLLAKIHQKEQYLMNKVLQDQQQNLFFRKKQSQQLDKIAKFKKFNLKRTVKQEKKQINGLKQLQFKNNEKIQIQKELDQNLITYNQFQTYEKLIVKSRLQETLKNVHVFYKLRVQQMREEKKTNDFILVEFLHQIKNIHQEKLFLLKSCIQQQMKSKLLLCQSQKNLSKLSSSMEKAIQVSIQEKQKNQSLNQKLNKKKQILCQKKQKLMKLRKQIKILKQKQEKRKAQQDEFQKWQKLVSFLLSQQNTVCKQDCFEQ